jgi:hypothetical protein
MTEAEWLGATEPLSMLQFLASRRGTPDDRKLRLFACACVRRLLPLLSDRRCRAALETSEAFAEGRSIRRNLEAVHRAAQQVASAAWSAWMGTPEREQAMRVAQAVVSVTLPDALPAAWDAARDSALVGSLSPAAVQADLLREIFGNPFRTVAVDPAWLSWNGRVVTRLVREIHEEGRYEHLPVLADALEEAGCQDEGLLRHCRQPEGHVRGCWAVDGLLAALGG